jgi:hypothetical protein
MRRRILAVLTTVVVATVGLVAAGTAPGGAASTPLVGASPNIRLVDGQTVTIFGRDFDDTPLSAGWRAFQCDSGVLDGPIAQQLIAHCDPTGPPGVMATDGALSIEFVVHRSIRVGEEGRPVTCGITSRDCALAVAAGTTTGGFVGAATPISFLGDHTVTVTPSTGLRDGQTVAVTGTGYIEAPVLGEWAVLQCSAKVVASPFTADDVVNECSQNPPYGSAPPDPSGNISGSLEVRKTFVAGAGATAHSVTCGAAPQDCAIVVAHFTTEADFVGAAAPISFATPVPTLRDCIRSFLGDHQHRPAVKLHRLLVCIFTALTHKPH